MHSSIANCSRRAVASTSEVHVLLFVSSSDRSRNYSVPDRNVRQNGQSVSDGRQPDGELSHLLTRNDYDLPGLNLIDL